MPIRYPQIQGIRALAIIGIFLAHTTRWLPNQLSEFVPVALRLGGAGVAVFFIISGFLLAYKHKVVQIVDKKNVISSAWQKVKKLYVPHLIALVLCLLLKLPETAYDWLAQSVFMLFHLTLTQSFIPYDAMINAFNAPSWFLSAFFGIWIIIYLFPQCVNSLMNVPVRRCVCGIIAIFAIQILWMCFVKYGISPVLPKRYLAWGHDWLVYKNPMICFSEFCVGILLGRLCAQKQLRVSTQNVIAILTALVVLAYGVLLLKSVISPSLSRMVVAEVFACVGIVAVMAPESVGYRILSKRVLVWMGDISAYFFLLHTPIIFLMRIIEPQISLSWLILISFALTLILSGCINKLYELQRVKKEFQYK